MSDTPTVNLNLSLIEPNRPNWSDAMNNNLVLIDTAIGTFFLVNEIQGVWENSTTYAVGMVVADSTIGQLYQSRVLHISAAVPTTFAQERAAHTDYWGAIEISPSFRGVWATNTFYNNNDFVTYNTNYYVCKVSHTAGVFATDLSNVKWELLVDFATPVAAIDASVATAATLAAGILATSTTNITPSVASKVFTTQSGKQFQAGQWISVVSASTPTVWMFGQVTSYTGTTLTVDSQVIGTAAAATDWNISISGARGAIGATGATGAAGSPATVHTITIASQANVSNTTHITSAYKWYELNILNLLPATDGTSILFQFTIAGVAVSDATYNYAASTVNSTGAGASGDSFGVNKTSIELTVPGDDVSNVVTDGGVSGYIKMFNPSSTAGKKGIVWNLTYINDAGDTVNISGGGTYAGSNSAVDGFFMTMTAGGMVSGTIIISGGV